MAWRSIRGNKLRSFLTMLGMIIGVSSVIVLVSIGRGSSEQVTSQINQLGTNLLTVNVMNSDEVKLTVEDMNKFRELSGVKDIAPIVSGRVNVKQGTASAQVSLIGTTASYEAVRDVNVSSGRFLSDIDIEYRQKIVVLGATIAQTLFGFGDPVGQYVQIDGTSFKVVGVLASKGGSLGQSGDDVILMPLSTAQRLTKTMNIQTVYIQADKASDVNFVMVEAKRLLAHLFPNNEDSYSVFNQQDLMETVSSVADTMTLMLGGIAGISLLVGGIGIMNIMLVSVSERTKEIGIRKAVGAKRRHILLQFLVEAVVLSSCGGAIGVVLGFGVGQVLKSVMGMTISYSPSVSLLAFLFSLLVGVVFGVFPANKAAKLDPIQALRYE
ncbi:ABC transporter permease [Geobacillus zalihae]|uniref:ABC transporter permease n=2 Tax=Geobacillus TaxID=129337 RepID=A0A7H1S051_9BACL|nr:ABC transporter permease [Geobacillus zalihae]QOR85814.1 ABC transporter permease [Geobacillus stearothermophilus]RXS92111.1 FtsX-like permease family protein [Geobacillus sp. PK12]